MKGLRIVCEGPEPHEQTLLLPQHDAVTARALGDILDGTSAFFTASPRNDPGSVLAHCQLCHATIRCTLFGFDEAPPA